MLKVQNKIAVTLKDKRSVVKSLKDRLGNKYNVSVGEVGHNKSVLIIV